MRPFVFLDRDGTLIEDRGYIHRVEDYVPLPGVFVAVARLRAAGFGIAIVTNQSGIGRGYFTWPALERFHAHLFQDFERQQAPIDAAYVCPHTPAERCFCRKPATGMIDQACAEFSIDLERSWVVGDKRTDVELGLRAGCRSLRVSGPHGGADSKAADGMIVRDLGEAADCILARGMRRRISVEPQ